MTEADRSYDRFGHGWLARVDGEKIFDKLSYRLEVEVPEILKSVRSYAQVSQTAALLQTTDAEHKVLPLSRSKQDIANAIGGNFNPGEARKSVNAGDCVPEVCLSPLTFSLEIKACRKACRLKSISRNTAELLPVTACWT